MLCCTHNCRGCAAFHPSIHPYIHTFTPPSIHTYIHTYTHKNIHPSTHTSIHSPIHVAYVACIQASSYHRYRPHSGPYSGAHACCRSAANAWPFCAHTYNIHTRTKTMHFAAYSHLLLLTHSPAPTSFTNLVPNLVPNHHHATQFVPVANLFPPFHSRLCPVTNCSRLLGVCVCVCVCVVTPLREALHVWIHTNVDRDIEYMSHERSCVCVCMCVCVCVSRGMSINYIWSVIKSICMLILKGNVPILRQRL